MGIQENLRTGVVKVKTIYLHTKKRGISAKTFGPYPLRVPGGRGEPGALSKKKREHPLRD